MSRQAAFDIVVLSPFDRPDARLVAAVARSGGLGLLDLGRDLDAAVAAMEDVARHAVGRWGVRIADGCPVTPDSLAADAAVVLVAAESAVEGIDTWRRPGRVVWVEVNEPGAAERAAAAGADALVVRGNECGGDGSAQPAFVLLQAVLDATDLPVYVAGGISRHTAAAAVVGGAAGVLVDVQVALLPESAAPSNVRAVLAAADGSETTVVGGYRVYVRPGTLAAGLPADAPRAQVRDLLGVDDLATQVLPLGQDAALASQFARDWTTVGAAVRGLRAAVVDAIRLAAGQRLLVMGEFARAHGLGLPVVQGPMTRVSDTPPFAAAVSEAGGLPVVALSEKSGEECRALLRETAELLGDRPWGAGVLGFLDGALRDEQMQALRDVRPPFAVVAGGRPAQARALENAGIVTFLHVPSPGLLAQFLRDGARRFVFEGQECGGHIGPRSSFALWSAQVDVLLQSEHASDVDVLFAGGIHDARSAAMVAAVAAPLAERGARIGVLLGTAYLFTEEIVRTGAITASYQNEALRCEATALLETSPGHATRCAETPYVTAFEAERRRLTDDGLDPSTVWAQLELLNLGRLRIASKGLRREGDTLVPVPAAEQREAGMFMLGQVAALRRTTTTVARLHDEVTHGAVRHMERVAERMRLDDGHPSPRPLDVAIVGMASVLPGAADADAFWTNVVTGVDAVSEVPAARWDPAIFFDPGATGPSAGEKTPSKWGGFLSPIPFDALAHGIPPRSLASIEPVQLLALHVASAALEDAGYGRGERPLDRSRVAVLFGAEAGTDLSAAYSLRATGRQYLGPLPEAADSALPRLTEDSFPGMLTNVIAGRVANRLDLAGPNFTVDAACASSLAALDAGIKELITGTSDVALVGGADLHNGVNDYLLFASVHALSPTGRCAPFDASADGIALGEGVGCLVLKRLADAERDGDRIYAVIEGVGAASDGRSLGLTAPRPEGQRLALERAYRQAGVNPAEVGLVEAHGTGTVVGDRTELAVLEDVFGAAGTDPARTVLGSVKSQIGHTKCTAGLAGLIKAVRAVHAGVLPPTIHLESPNPGWSPSTSHFRFHTTARPWPAAVRRAAVSAFGFGGTNFHVVLRAPDGGQGEPEHGLCVWPAELFALRGRTPEDARTLAARLAAYVDAVDPAVVSPALLRDLAAATWQAGSGTVRAAFVVRDLAELSDRLRTLDLVDVPAVAPTVTMLFPGQGSQRPQMFAQLFAAFPWLQRHLAPAGDLVDVIYPPAAFDAETRAAQNAALTDTRVAQPALGMVELAIADLLARLGVRPASSGGHSYGELTALAVSGALPADRLVELSKARAGAILAAVQDDPGRMAAVAASAAMVRDVLGAQPGVVVANDNSPQQVVVSGASEAVDEAVERLRRAGLTVRPLSVACAFHSPLLRGAAADFAEVLDVVPLRAPHHAVWSNAVAAPYPLTPDGVRELLGAQVEAPVRFREQVEAMYAAGSRLFVEVGPGRVLTNLVHAVLADRPHTAIAVDGSGRGELADVLTALGDLATAGVAVDLTPLFAGRARALDLMAAPPEPPGWLVDGHLVRTRGGAPVEGGLRPASELSAPAATVGGAASIGDPRTEAVLAYLRTVREAVAAGRDALLGYLGAAAPAGSAAAAADAAAPSSATVQPVPATTVPEPAAVVPGQRTPPDAGWTLERITRLVLDTIAARTGYPDEMLGGELDLEADLSIDSIKRLEIVGELAVQLDLAAADAPDEGLVEQLVGIKRINAIAQWLHDASGARRPATVADDPPVDEQSADAGPATSGMVARRFVPRLLDLPVTGVDAAAAALSGRRICVEGQPGLLRDAIRSGLAAAGVEVVADTDDVDPIDDVVHVVAPSSRPGLAPQRLLTAAQGALRRNARTFVVITSVDGALGTDRPVAPAALEVAGVRGLVKTLRRELTPMDVRLIDIDPALAPADAASVVVSEVGLGGGEAEIGRTHDARRLVTVVSEPLPDDVSASPPFGPDDVVLLTGGARGVTATVARWLARTGCRLELIGRTPLVPPERPDVEAAEDAVALRRLLAADHASPAEIERSVSRLLAEREVRRTVRDLERLGATVTYHSVDVRDGAAVSALVADVYRRHGRLDAVVHGAGVIEDARATEKTEDSFGRVFDTKFGGAVALLDAVRPDVRYVVLFGSVAGLVGNAGQSDYAAANDGLATLARSASARMHGRVVTIHWGPWGGGVGMVSPALARELERRGLFLLDPDDAVAALGRELRSEVDEPEVAVVATTTGPHAEAPFEAASSATAGDTVGDRTERR